MVFQLFLLQQEAEENPVLLLPWPQVSSMGGHSNFKGDYCM